MTPSQSLGQVRRCLWIQTDCLRAERPDLLVNEANPDPMDADAWPESAEAPDISSPLVNSSGAVDHLNELVLMELDAGCAGGGHP